LLNVTFLLNMRVELYVYCVLLPNDRFLRQYGNVECHRCVVLEMVIYDQNI
jgi:uncharacterized protein YlbG (UPF0298 family)